MEFDVFYLLRTASIPNPGAEISRERERETERPQTIQHPPTQPTRTHHTRRWHPHKNQKRVGSIKRSIPLLTKNQNIAKKKQCQEKVRDTFLTMGDSL